MLSTKMTELALRTAVNTTPTDLTFGSNPSEDIKVTALNRAKELVTGNSSDSAMGAQLSVQSMAIGLAVQGLALAFAATMAQLGVLKDKRLSFDKERQAGIATFIIPTDIEERNLSTEERIIKAYVDLIFKSPNFSAYATYLGIKTSVLAELENANFYSVLPFYRMSDALIPQAASPRPLDRERTAINLFFRSAIPEAMDNIENDFQTDVKFVEFFKSAFERGNYLNDLRSPRFVMMSLANLLWNLQHPVDPVTGFPLSVDRCIVLCREVELFLNQLLNKDAAPYLKGISNDENQLISFVRKIEIHTKALRAAYAEEQLHELNIGDVTNGAHQALRIMDKSVFKLIYKRVSPVTGREEPDEKAAEDMAYTISYLNQLIMRNAGLLEFFQPHVKFVPTLAGINFPPSTVMDALIIYCHMTTDERHDMLNIMEKTKIDSALEFAQTLRQFNKKFVKPIREVSKKELKTSLFNSKQREVAILTSQRLIPFITLVMEDYRIGADTEESYQAAKHSISMATRVYSGKEQIKMINKSAETGDVYYVWLLSPFIQLAQETEDELDKLPKHQYRMTQITELLDSVSEIVLNYRSFLQSPVFQVFLIKCLDNVKKEYAKLERHIEEIDSYLAKDECMSRGMQAILRPMTSELNGSLEAFSLAMANFEHVVSAPDFTDKQKQLLSTKLNTINEQFKALFEEDSGIRSLAAHEQVAATVPMLRRLDVGIETAAQVVEARKVLAIRKVVQNCFDALSYQSKYGHKGELLTNLLAMIDRNANFTQVQIKHVIMELTHVTASYRETWFFQAGYGQTRSAQALISAIKDPNVNGVLPLASIMFGRDINFNQLSDAEILQQLRSMRDGNHWEESASQIGLVLAI